MRTRPNAVACDHTDRPHEARGLCQSCYCTWLRRNNEKARKANLATSKRYYRRNRHKVRERNVLKQYGLTPQRLKQEKEKQNNLCLLCDGPPVKEGPMLQAMLVIDHDHDTNTYRGLLCHPCNRWLGYLEKALKNPAWLKKALIHIGRDGICE